MIQNQFSIDGAGVTGGGVEVVVLRISSKRLEGGGSFKKVEGEKSASGTGPGGGPEGRENKGK